MKVESLDNRVILYLEGNEDMAALTMLMLKSSDIRGVPTKELADTFWNGVNCVPTIGVWQDETDSDEHLVSNDALQRYRAMVADWHREWIKARKAEGEEYGTRAQREYAARSAAYERAGRPDGVKWTEPGSIAIPEDIQTEYGLERSDRKTGMNNK